MTAKPKASAKNQRLSLNTSAAAAPGNTADVSAAEAVQAASQSIAPKTGQSTSDKIEATPPEEDVKQAPPVTHLLVVAKKEGFRRAGRAWSAVEIKVAVDQFSHEQILDLASEPMLDVVFVSEAE